MVWSGGIGVDFEATVDEVEDPIVGDVGVGVNGELFGLVVGEGGFGDFDDQECVGGGGMSGDVAGVRALDDGDVGFRDAGGELDGGLRTVEVLRWENAEQQACQPIHREVVWRVSRHFFYDPSVKEFDLVVFGEDAQFDHA